MKAGFSCVNITPRLGVELFGYGPYINRHSESVRDLLEVRTAVLESRQETLVVAGCDLCGITPEGILKAKELIRERHPSLTDAGIFICCSHCHTGPGVSSLGDAWGRHDPAWERILPCKIAASVDLAFKKMEEVSFSTAVVPCEGIGLNRVYDRFSVPREEGILDTWRPEKPELTDTKSAILKFTRKDGSTAGFFAYYGAHPVVCGKSTAISGDYPAIAIHDIMRSNPGTVGIFLQGALGDVNTCLVGDPDKTVALGNLDVIARRFERAIRLGLEKSMPSGDETLAGFVKEYSFATKSVGKSFVEQFKKDQWAEYAKPDATEENCLMATAYLDGMARLEQYLKDHPDGTRKAVLHGLRLGPVSLLGAPFEIFQAIKRDVVKNSKSPFPLVVSLTDGEYGYAPDNESLLKTDGYESKISPLLSGLPAFSNVHNELKTALLEIDAVLHDIRTFGKDNPE